LATKELAFIQGFYNMFLAIVTFVGIVLYAFECFGVGLALVFAGTGSMLAAALVSPRELGAPTDLVARQGTRGDHSGAPAVDRDSAGVRQCRGGRQRLLVELRPRQLTDAGQQTVLRCEVSGWLVGRLPRHRGFRHSRGDAPDASILRITPSAVRVLLRA
jgi:hypothetical protein